MADGMNPTVTEVFGRWEKEKKHPEIVEFEKGIITSPLRQAGNANIRRMNVWEFIKDAIKGTGGFADGSYLVPHKRELTGSSAGNLSFTSKFFERCETADYDDFARSIHEGPINYIVQSKDQIKRTTDDVNLEKWWSNVDGRGTNLEDFLLGFPSDQARSYGTAWVFMDREQDVKSEADNQSKEPYVYCVPTRNVVWWEFDDDGDLEALVVCEPKGCEEVTKDCPVRIWTKDAWAVFVPANVKREDGSTFVSWTVESSGPNPLGRIPVARLFDEQAPPKHGMGSSIMLQIARIARTVYNMESEAREIMRKAAFPILAIPTRDTAASKKIEIGNDSALPFDSDGGMPAWIEPNLNSLDKYEARIEKKKEGAFSVAHMKAIVGSVKTSSGFHTEAEFDETNRAIGDFASSLESVEMELGVLYLGFRGVDVTAAVDMVQVSYPREFKLRDMDDLIDRTVKRLNMNLGEDDAFEAIRDLYAALYPRRPQDEIEVAARKAANERTKNLKALESVGLNTTSRVKNILAGKGGALEGASLAGAPDNTGGAAPKPGTKVKASVPPKK